MALGFPTPVHWLVYVIHSSPNARTRPLPTSLPTSALVVPPIGGGDVGVARRDDGTSVLESDEGHPGGEIRDDGIRSVPLGQSVGMRAIAGLDVRTSAPDAVLAVGDAREPDQLIDRVHLAGIARVAGEGDDPASVLDPRAESGDFVG